MEIYRNAVLMDKNDIYTRVPGGYNYFEGGGADMNNKSKISIGEIKHPLKHIPKNVHDVWEIIYYTAGEGVNVIGGKRLPFVPGQIVFQPPGYAHEEFSENGFTNYFLVADLDFRAYFSEEIPVFFDCPDGRIKNIFYNLSAQQADGDDGLGLAYDYVSLLVKLCSLTTRENNGNVYVKKIKSELLKNLSVPHYRVSCAFEGIPLSRDYARLLFIWETGKTPSGFLISSRIERAKSLLKTCALPLKAIARETGFDDAYHFSRVFKKIAGVSPAAWRKEQSADGFKMPEARSGKR